jgi:hypothetical protein
MKKISRTFIEEIKQLNTLDKIYKEKIINFNDYFKYSGKVEKYKPIKEFACNQPIPIALKSNDPVIRFYYKNSDLSFTKIGKKLGVSYGTVKKKLDEHYKQLKLKRNGCKNT